MGIFFCEKIYMTYFRWTTYSKSKLILYVVKIPPAKKTEPMTKLTSLTIWGIALPRCWEYWCLCISLTDECTYENVRHGTPILKPQIMIRTTGLWPHKNLIDCNPSSNIHPLVNPDMWPKTHVNIFKSADILVRYFS